MFRFTPHSMVQTRSAVSLASKVYGEKEEGVPVVILHGMLGSGKNWTNMSNMISTECHKKVVAADLRNHGRSPHTSSHTYPELVADVSKLIHSRDLKEATIIGHSMGGRTGMALALTEPIIVNSLVIVDISPISIAASVNAVIPKLLDIMKEIDLNGFFSVSDARGSVKKTLTNIGLFLNETTINFLVLNIVRRDGRIVWKFNIDTLKKHFSDIISFPDHLKTKQFNGPVLFIGGEHSEYLPKTDIPLIQKIFPNSEFTYIPRAGHTVHADDPFAFFKLVKEFLAIHS